MKKYIRKIATKEQLEITPDGLESLIFIAKGDMRKAINVLQVGKFRLIEGSNDHIQLESLLAQFVLFGKKLK